MYSYIATHHFSPKTDYQPLTDLIPFIDQTLAEQNAVSKMDEKAVRQFKDNILKCMEVYYKLVGIDDKVINAKGEVAPQGVLVRFTESLIGYFQELERHVPSSKENDVLKYSGVNTIKIRYKYTDSVIKKLVKLGLHDSKSLDDPLKVFLKGGALHDLIGMLFICSYPYEKEWVARTLYNFFEYDNRTDDHLLYGFYTVEKKSGYSGLHCDHTFFNPRFDVDVLGKNDTTPSDANTIFTLLEPQDSSVDVLRKLKDYFNIEIQLHTTFESLWSSMEHTSNYNIQAKGKGRSSKITVQWKILSDAMKNLEAQFERLQIDTEQARFEVLHHGGYIPIQVLLNELGSDAYAIYAASVKKVEDLEDDLKNHEISRQDYVEQLQVEARAIDDFSVKQNDSSVEIVFRMHSAFIYYGLSNQSEYFNMEDIREFVKKALHSYRENINFLTTDLGIHRGALISIVAIFRYLYLGQKYGLGLINPPKGSFVDVDTPVVVYVESLDFFEKGIALLNELDEDELEYLDKNSVNMLKIIHHYDVLAREWELFNTQNDAPLGVSIATFRNKFVTIGLQKNFNALLESDKIKNVGFVVEFYASLVWHGFLRPRDALKQIIKYSAYDKIKTSDLFYYELSAYRFLVVKRCKTTDDCHKALAERHGDPVRIEHYKNYHRKNMIQLLFRIKKSESVYKFYKAKLEFEQMTQTQFKMDHFSEMLYEKV